MGRGVKLFIRRTQYALLATVIVMVVKNVVELNTGHPSLPIRMRTSKHTLHSYDRLPRAVHHRHKPVLIFLHPPKSGGSLLRRILRQWCAATRKSCFEADWSTSHSGLPRLKNMNASQRNSIDVLFGHLPFGIHLPLQLSRLVKYVTLLRDPVRQAISAFHFQRLTQHNLGGAFELQSALDHLNNTLRLRAALANHTDVAFLLDNQRNDVISRLTSKPNTSPNATGCFSFGDADGWSRVHNASVQYLQSLDTASLVQFAARVLTHAWTSNCTTPLSPMLSLSFVQFLRVSRDLDATWRDDRPQWDFGNNPTATLYCCHHLWINTTSSAIRNELQAKCPRVRNEETLACALNNMDEMELILVTEKMALSLQLLENYLNWTIPTNLKELRINAAVYVPPPAGHLTSSDLSVAENMLSLDRTLYRTALTRFWSDVRASGELIGAT